ncbi:hypothetical protein [Pedobacter sp. Hv1]|uniref:hypothetical protein n=1 Tax=Pedobacter sp. Hv1 TaxID=1740090 RepID=UPI00128F143A|nr:hypothetical protein [Pedobacter sp. Hv1]
MMLKKLLLLFLLVLPTIVFAQTALTGNIFDNENRTNLLQGVAVKNLSNKSFVLTDKDGHFAIAAKVGDLISFGMAGFETDTVYLINLFPRNVYLRVQVTSLNAVNVTAAKISPYLNFKDPNAVAARGVDYSKDRGGLRLNLGYGKYRREQAKLQALIEDEKYQEEINKNFNAEYVKNLIKFEGEDLKNFIAMFRPTVEQVKADRPFNYSFYTVKAYHAWLKLPPSQRKLPPLVKKTN